MCGIAGWLTHPASDWAPSSAAVEKALYHRGPDDGGAVQLGPAGLVHRRLTLLDAEHGRQPASDESGRYWAVFNGEIYNHADLRRDLRGRGHRIAGHGDSELVPHLYEEYGAEFLTQLRGMFALAVFDRDRDELLLARDPFGIKPLYWARTPRGLLFGSEVAALTAADPAASWPVDPRSVWHYLSYGYVPDPLTMWAGIQRVAPGQRLRVRGGHVDARTYASPRFSPVDQPLSRTRDEVAQAVSESVRAHLAADVPVGAYLSSGVDSTYLATLAARHTPLRTFSVGFAGAAEGRQETSAAAETARRLGTEHHEEIITARAWRDALPEVVAAQGEPLADPSAPALWFLARLAAGHVKAVLSGEGADELFAGYPIYRTSPLLRAVSALPDPVTGALGRLADRLPAGTKGRGLMHRAATPLPQRFLGNAPVFPEPDKRALLADGFDGGPFPEPSHLLCAPHWADAGRTDVVGMQTVSCRTWLPASILTKADRMSMAHSLEVRVPFLDPGVLAAAARVPADQRVHGRSTKVALRAAAGQALSPDAAQRPKMGFPVPFRRWLDGPLDTLARELAGATSGSLLHGPAVERVLADRRSPGSYRRRWAVLVYLLWEAQQPADGPPRPPE